MGIFLAESSGSVSIFQLSESRSTHRTDSQIIFKVVFLSLMVLVQHALEIMEREAQAVSVQMLVHLCCLADTNSAAEEIEGKTEA